MKKLLTVAIIGLLVFSCKEEKRTDFVINGTAPGVYNGIRVYLKIRDYKTKREISIDTAIVINEKFSFVSKSEYPELRFLTVDNIPGKLPVIIENNNMSININKDNIASSVITGSSTQKDYENYEKALSLIKKQNKLTLQNYKNASRVNNLELRDSLLVILKDFREQLTQFPIQYSENNPKKFLSLILIEQEIQKDEDNIKIFKEVFDNLDDDIKNSPKGRKLSVKINTLDQVSIRTKQLQIGEIAPNFEAPTPDGDIVSLNQLKGKVTIIDFWAAWCGPCRRENPNVVRIYNQYHDQGLEIIGVSLDGQSRQNEPKKAWLEAIEKDNLTWHQVSYLKYFNDPVAQLYSIKSIPAAYILDAEGKIAAKNLRGKALELKVQELLNK